MTSITYPPGPRDVPGNLTSLSGSYKIKAALAVLAIILFFALYVGLVIGLVLFVEVVWYLPIPNLFLKLAALAGSVMLVAFTVKFIFKLRLHKRPDRIKLEDWEHPALFEFVGRLCDDTGAPFPKAIYVDPNVNAYVSYTNVWLSLIFPVRKELTIGLGLVSTLNMREFKAVIAHEFGHFAQRSMRIGSYIHSANAIIYDMIYERDAWDRALENWRNQGIWLIVVGYTMTGLIWVIRQVLGLFYRFLNLMNSSLSREMEFNADKFAVKAAGSEAIVSSLWVMEHGHRTLALTFDNAYLASQKEMYVRNIYHQCTTELDRTSEQRDSLRAELQMDEYGCPHYFTTSEPSGVAMYASHPPNDARERNAKTPFIECDEDTRSPWILFRDPQGLQERMTKLWYEVYLDKQPESYSEQEEFDAFMTAETTGTDLLKEYHNCFADRFLLIPDDDKVAEANRQTASPQQRIESLKLRLDELMEPIREIHREIDRLQKIASGEVKARSFSYNGITYAKSEFEQAHGALIRRRQNILGHDFSEWDTEFCAVHILLAGQCGRLDELRKIYAQHQELVTMFMTVLGVMNRVMEGVEYLRSLDAVSSSDLTEFGEGVAGLADELNGRLRALDKLDFVPMSNVDTVDELRNAIIEGGRFSLEPGDPFVDGRLDRFMNSLQRARLHCRRLDLKSIIHILELHKLLERECLGSDSTEKLLTENQLKPGHE